MQNKPWTMKHGFLIGGIIIAAGLALQVSAGPVAWHTLAWPMNGIMLAVFLAVIAAIYLLRKRIYACRFIGTAQASIPTLLYAVALTIGMGLTRQEPHGKWLSDALTCWPFVLIYVYMTLQLGVIIVRRLMHLTVWQCDIPFLLNHLGLFVALTTGTLGNADMQRVKMVTTIGMPEWRAMEGSMIKEMPMTIELKQFIMETYDDGSPKRYASELLIKTQKGESVQAVVDVNKPVEIDGWKIYQYGYDTEAGAKSQISILELVSDPWLPLVYMGIYMMLAGAVCLFIIGGRRKRV